MPALLREMAIPCTATSVGYHVTLDVGSTGVYWTAVPSGLWLFIAVPWSIMYVGCLYLRFLSMMVDADPSRWRNGMTSLISGMLGDSTDDAYLVMLRNVAWLAAILITVAPRCEDCPGHSFPLSI